ncbi:hypothetical protein BCR43DRAFT_290046 [Syncephalastrum racemosum]|uniref:Uncharacterized protein n=1 Tax=Syncephalastrum racemosum TaxID=13706 RepID=A0A1X2HDH0_SYNRA|nr:hypothetical protein BCR43DRAFT_290046 [Syncephalastrum racemosum]
MPQTAAVVESRICISQLDGFVHVLATFRVDTSKAGLSSCKCKCQYLLNDLMKPCFSFAAKRGYSAAQAVLSTYTIRSRCPGRRACPSTHQASPGCAMDESAGDLLPYAPCRGAQRCVHRHPARGPTRTVHTGGDCSRLTVQYGDGLPPCPD